MGEVLARLYSGQVHGRRLEIEINKPHAPGMPGDVHIEVDGMRYQLDEREFVRLGMVVLRARRELLALKGMDGDR